MVFERAYKVRWRRHCYWRLPSWNKYLTQSWALTFPTSTLNAPLVAPYLLYTITIKKICHFCNIWFTMWQQRLMPHSFLVTNLLYLNPCSEIGDCILTDTDHSCCSESETYLNDTVQSFELQMLLFSVVKKTVSLIYKLIYEGILTIRTDCACQVT